MTRQDFPLPLRFVQKFGPQLPAIAYTIDEQDNALELLLNHHGEHHSISVVSLSEMEVFYCMRTYMYFTLRYVGHGIFFFTLFDRDQSELELFPDDESYVACLLPADQLNYIETELLLKYIVPAADDADSEPIELSSDSNSAESSEHSLPDIDSASEQSAYSRDNNSDSETSSDSGDVEIIDRNEFMSAVKQKRSASFRKQKKKPNAPNTRYLGFGKFELTINLSLLKSYRIYLPSQFARDLRRIGGQLGWIVRGPVNHLRTDFGFEVIPSGGRGNEWKF